MRTTLAIDDDVLEAARSRAQADGTTVGQVISELARRGLAPREEVANDQGFPVFTVSRVARPLTPEMVRRAADEE